MPKYVVTNDSSARTLSLYKTVTDNSKKLTHPEQDDTEETFTV